MLTKRERTRIEMDYNKNEDIHLIIDSGKYKGSVVKIQKINYIYGWDHSSYAQRYLLWAPGLIKCLSHSSKTVSVTDKIIPHLTSTPTLSVLKDPPRDFVGVPIKIKDIVFGQGMLLEVINILPNNSVETKCVQTDKTYTHRNMKKYFKIEDPIQTLLRI